MTPLKKVLCPIDCSEGSRSALDYALFVSKHFSAELHVLHAWHVAHHVRPDLSVWAEAHGQQPITNVVASAAKAETEKFLASLDEATRRTIKVHVEEGEAWRLIVDRARNGHFDMVIMGTHGRSGIAHLAIGSVAEKVVRHAPCPVLTVRHSK